MVSGISGSNLATSLRELDRVTPPTQQDTLAQSYQRAKHSVILDKTDTVNISQEALAMSKRADQAGREPSDITKQGDRRDQA